MTIDMMKERVSKRQSLKHCFPEPKLIIKCTFFLDPLPLHRVGIPPAAVAEPVRPQQRRAKASFRLDLDGLSSAAQVTFS